MALLSPEAYYLPEPDWASVSKDAHTLAFDLLVASSDALPVGEYVGGLLAFPVADGGAYYRVASLVPLVLQHVPYGDAYRADPLLIRGLRRATVEARVDHNRRGPTPPTLAS